MAKRTLILELDATEPDSNGKVEYYVVVRGLFPITNKKEMAYYHNKLARLIKIQPKKHRQIHKQPITSSN